MCFKQPKVQAAPAPPPQPAFVAPKTSENNTGASVRGGSVDGTADTAAMADSQDMAIRRKRRSAAAGLGL